MLSHSKNADLISNICGFYGLLKVRRSGDPLHASIKLNIESLLTPNFYDNNILGRFFVFGPIFVYQRIVG